MEYLNELTKDDHKMLKGIAVTGMVMLHLFCRLGDLPYTPLIWIKGIPLIYYLGLFGDICVPVFAFLSGYAHYLQYENSKSQYIKNIKKLSSFILNIWIVICLVAVLGILFDKTNQIPGSISLFIRNLLLIDSYAGAWWYIAVYILLVFFSVLLFDVVRKNNSLLITMIFFGIYAVTYYLRFHDVFHLEGSLLSWMYTKIVLLGNSMFSYVIGMIYRKHRIISQLKCKNSSIKRGFALLVFVSFIIHCFFQSVSIAPLNAFVVITGTTINCLPAIIKKVFRYLGIHSTNIWLLHMFCYLYIFRGLVFQAKYPLAILILTIAICCIISYMINNLLEKIKSALKEKTKTN